MSWYLSTPRFGAWQSEASPLFWETAIMSSAHRLIRTVIFAAWMCTAVLGFAANALVTLVLSTSAFACAGRRMREARARRWATRSLNL
jgi:hypothetical protein